MIGFATESPNISGKTVDFVFYTASIIITILSAFILNIIYRKSLKLKKNNKTTSLIFFTHILLIPLTYLFVIYLLSGGNVSF